jgi:Ni,Fe-hydrogenase III small subunit
MSKTYIVPEEISSLNSLEDKLELLKNIKRSFSIYRVDCGSCNGCEIEIFASITPMWDPERFGFKLVASPRHADILLCTGPLTRQMYYPLLRAYEATPDPKVVVAYGACGSTGGIFHDAYSVWGGIDKVIPVDVWIPGCPPHPASTIYGLATALGILEQKLEHIVHKDDSNEAPELKESLLSNILFERDVLAKSKILMAYLHGRVLSKKYLDALKSSKDPFDPKLSKIAVEKAIKNEEDKRYAECMTTLHNEIYLKHIAGFTKVSSDDRIVYNLTA